MSRQLFKRGTEVIINGKKYIIEYDYEDLIYVIGVKEPFQPNQIKKA